MNQVTGKEVWDNTKELLGSYKVILGTEGSEMIWNDPKRMGALLSRYKFAAKMACKTGKVLELDCGEGLGAKILSESVDYTGVDKDPKAIETALKNFPQLTFISEDFLCKKYGDFDAVISIHPNSGPKFFQTVLKNLAPSGIAVVCGTEKVASEMKKSFHHVFSFGISDEIVHTGPSNDLICVGCHAKN